MEFYQKPLSIRSKSTGGNTNTLLTGDGFKKLQGDVQKLRPSKLVSLQIADLLDDITCVRCRKVPNPYNLMACESGHYTCGECTFLADQVESLLIAEGRVSVIEKCCYIYKLHKEPPFLLKALLDRTEFICPNKDKGCSVTVFGFDNFHEHRRNCHLSVTYKCRFNNCSAKVLSVEDLLQHYKTKHNGRVFTLTNTNNRIILPISFKETLQHRLCAILKVKKYHFVYACERKDDNLFIWIWTLDHEPMAMGRKTKVWYNLTLKQVRKISTEENVEELRVYEGRCLFHAVNPEDITCKGAWLVDAYKCNVNTFKNLFVQKTADGDGEWAVLVTVRLEDDNKK